MNRLIDCQLADYGGRAGRNLCQVLPQASFVPFECWALTSPKVIWRSQEPKLSNSVEDYAYCVPMAGELPAAYGSESKTYLAERYGGQGINRNGGGARCGIRGGFQIKGVGRTPVAGRDAAFWYSHGGASLQEGVREALWGEVCNVALPYGGVRACGLILTGTSCPYNARDGACTAQRTLIVRQAAIRPAHYMRAAHFSPSDSFAKSFVSDSARTKAAIRAIRRAFEVELNISSDSLLACVNDGLMEMVRRIACQVSAATAKRLMHGALGCSNVCLNGGWVDYGTITSISDYGRIIVAKNNPDFWFQHQRLIKTIHDFCFYLSKYLPKEASPGVISPDSLISVLTSRLKDYLSIEYVKLVGIPFEILPGLVDKSAISAVYECFKKVISTGNSEPFKLAPDRAAEMPGKMGAYSLNTLIQETSVLESKNDMDLAVQNALPSAQLRTEFCSAIWNLRESFLMKVGDELRQSMRSFIMFNAVRRNVSFRGLYRPNLDRSIDVLLDGVEGIPGFIAENVRMAKTLLQDVCNGEIELTGILERTDSGKTSYSGLTPEKSSRIISALNPSLVPNCFKRAAQKYAIQSL